jgi:hypothetical protein
MKTQLRGAEYQHDERRGDGMETMAGRRGNCGVFLGTEPVSASLELTGNGSGASDRWDGQVAAW